jgi:hypothetical protein
MQRYALGAIALVSLILGIAGVAYYGVDESQTSLIAGMCLRIGLVLGALWLALPQLKRLSGEAPPWVVGLVILCLLIVIARPRTIVVVGPILLVLAALALIGWLVKPPETHQRRK